MLQEQRQLGRRRKRMLAPNSDLLQRDEARGPVGHDTASVVVPQRLRFDMGFHSLAFQVCCRGTGG